MSCLAIAAVALHVASVHSQPGYRDFNPGVSVRSECGLVAGVYRSSQSKPGGYTPIVYAGYSAQTKWRWPVFASLALAHGYRSERTGKRYAIVPLPMAGVKVPVVGNVRAVFGFIPSLGPNPHVGHLMLEIGL